METQMETKREGSPLWFKKFLENFFKLTELEGPPKGPQLFKGNFFFKLKVKWKLKWKLREKGPPFGSIDFWTTFFK